MEIDDKLFSSLKIKPPVMSAAESEQLLTDIRREITVRRHRRLVYRVSAVAASVVLLFSAGFALSDRTSRHEREVRITGECFPAGNVTLVSEGNVVNLPPDADLTVTEGSVIKVKGAENIEKRQLGSGLHKLSAPYGKRASITLSDGSRVWLNSGTVMTFPDEFGDSREISVSGEIYIEVAKDSDRPFIVRTDKFDVKVYGTTFNVCAYRDDESSSVVLVEGKVSVSSDVVKDIELLPNQMSVCDEDGFHLIPDVDVVKYTSWRNNYMVLSHSTISETLRKIGRYYNVSFKTDGVALSEKTCSGKLYLSPELDEVMQSISVISDTDYKREGDDIYLVPKSH